MSTWKNTILPVILSTVWISVSEFARNEFLLKSFWINHYQAMGLTFPSAPVNGAVWGIWALVFSFAIFAVAHRFSLVKTALISWIFGFVMMWLVIGNLGVLPFGILYAAVPLSLLEAFVAAWITKRLI